MRCPIAVLEALRAGLPVITSTAAARASSFGACRGHGVRRARHRGDRGRDAALLDDAVRADASQRALASVADLTPPAMAAALVASVRSAPDGPMPEPRAAVRYTLRAPLSSLLSPMTGLSLYSRLSATSGPTGGRSVSRSSAWMIVAAGDLMLAWLVIPIVRNFESPDPLATSWLPLTIVAVFLLRGVGAYISEFGMGWTGYRVVFDLRRDLIDKLPQAADAVLRHARRRRHPVEDLVRRAPARLGGLRRDHQRDPLDAHDRGELRLPHVAQLAAHAAHVHRRADRGRGDPLLQPPPAAHRARHPGPLGLADAGARGDDRRPPRRARVRR
jgi:hypothetical protein